MKTLKVLAVVLLAAFVCSNADAQRRMRYKAHYRNRHHVVHHRGPVRHR